MPTIITITIKDAEDGSGAALIDGKANEPEPKEGAEVSGAWAALQTIFENIQEAHVDTDADAIPVPKPLLN